MRQLKAEAPFLLRAGCSTRSQMTFWTPLSNHLASLSRMTWPPLVWKSGWKLFTVFVNCWVLRFVGTRAAVLIESSHRRLFSLANMGFSTTWCYTSETINEIALFFLGWFVLGVHKFTLEGVNWPEWCWNAKGLVGVLESFGNTHDIGNGHLDGGVIVLVRLLRLRFLLGLITLLALMKA